MLAIFQPWVTLMQKFYDILGPVAPILFLITLLLVFFTLERILSLTLFSLKKNQTSQTLQLLWLSYPEHTERSLRDEQLALELFRLKRKLNHFIPTIKFLASISPLVGLLGTMFGIIKSFQVIASETETVSPNLIAEGLWEALLTTAFGLSLALYGLCLAYALSYYSRLLLTTLQETLMEFSLKQALYPETSSSLKERS